MIESQKDLSGSLFTAGIDPFASKLTTLYTISTIIAVHCLLTKQSQTKCTILESQYI